MREGGTVERGREKGREEGRTEDRRKVGKGKKGGKDDGEMERVKMMEGEKEERRKRKERRVEWWCYQDHKAPVSNAHLFCLLELIHPKLGPLEAGLVR